MVCYQRINKWINRCYCFPFSHAEMWLKSWAKIKVLPQGLDRCDFGAL